MRRSLRWVLAPVLAALMSFTLALPLVLSAPGQALAEGSSQPVPAANQKGAPAKPTVATQISVALSQPKGNVTVAAAKLKDAGGKPLTNKSVTFIRKTTFGQLVVGTAQTDFQGEADMKLPAYAGQTIQVTAKFAGADGLAPSQAAASIAMDPPPITVVHGMYSEVPSPWYIAALVVLVGGVYVTFAVVYWLVRKIRQAA